MTEEAVVQLATVVINTTDEERLANFWSELLCVERGSEVPGFIWLKR